MRGLSAPSPFLFFLIWSFSHSSCCKEDQNFHLNYFEDQANSHREHHRASYILQPKLALGLITCRPSTCKPNREYSPSSNASNCSFLSGRKHSLLTKLQKRNNFPWRQQNRANFDSCEDITINDSKSSDHLSAIKPRIYFSSRKLSIVSCYRSATYFDTSPSSLNVSNASKTQVFSKKSDTVDGQKHISFSDPEYGSKYFPNLETRGVAPGRWGIERASIQPSLTSYYSLPTVISSSSQINVFTSSSQESQVNKDSEDVPYHRSQSHSTDYSPAALRQHLSQNVASSSLHNIGYKNADSLQAAQIEITSGPFEKENFAALPQVEDRPSPIEITEIRSSQISFLSEGQLKNQFSQYTHSKASRHHHSVLLESSLLSKWHCILGKRFLCWDLNLIG